MSFEAENVFGNRLKLARKMAGLSLQELADVLLNKVTKQALSKYEMGQMKPTSEVLLAISQVLKVSPDYFLKAQQVELGKISFRKKVSLSKKDEEALVEQARDYLERYTEIEAILAIDSEFENPISDIVIHSKQDVEIAATKLREIWELGNEPISNVVEMLELKGVKILLVEASEDIDGFAVFTSSGIPLVLINCKDKNVERIRFTIIHELAHLLLRFDEAILVNEKEIEVLCHCFASCLLIPSKVLIKMLGPKRTYIDIKELVAIKEYYGISLRALLHRLREVEIIIPSYYQRWVIFLSKNYGGKKEPGNYPGKEKSKLFDLLLSRALSEELISLSKAASLSNLSINELRKREKIVN